MVELRTADGLKAPGRSGRYAGCAPRSLAPLGRCGGLSRAQALDELRSSSLTSSCFPDRLAPFSPDRRLRRLSTLALASRVLSPTPHRGRTAPAPSPHPSPADCAPRLLLRCLLTAPLAPFAWFRGTSGPSLLIPRTVSATRPPLSLRPLRERAPTAMPAVQTDAIQTSYRFCFDIVSVSLLTMAG